MGAIDFARQIAPLNFMRSLCAGFDPLQLVFNGKFDGLIIAGFEMKEVKMFRTPPIAAENRVAAHQVESAGHRLAVVFGNYQNGQIGHGVTERRKKLASQIGAAPFPVNGVDVVTIKNIPMAFLDVVTGQTMQGNPLFRNPAPFLFYGFAFTGIKRFEKLIEGIVTAIFPMELFASAFQETGLAKTLLLILGRKGNMQRGDIVLPRQLNHPGGKNIEVFIIDVWPEQQAGPHGWRERNRRLEFGIIIATGSFIGFGPAPVKNIFAVGMVFQIGGYAGRHPPALIGGE